MPRQHIVVSGRVQGVGFRYHSMLLAQNCRLTGWVRNLGSGEVELEVQGKQEDLEQFLLKLERGSAFIRVDHLELEDREEIRESSFEIRQDD